jgi:hypothetical protein
LEGLPGLPIGLPIGFDFLPTTTSFLPSGESLLTKLLDSGSAETSRYVGFWILDLLSTSCAITALLEFGNQELLNRLEPLSRRFCHTNPFL